MPPAYQEKTHAHTIGTRWEAHKYGVRSWAAGMGKRDRKEGEASLGMEGRGSFEVLEWD